MDRQTQKDLFQSERNNIQPFRAIDCGGWWSLIGPRNSGNYTVALQGPTGSHQGTPLSKVRVVAGCRYFTVEQAFKHWSRRHLRAVEMRGLITFLLERAYKKRLVKRPKKKTK